MPDLSRKSLPLGTRPALVLVDMIEAFTDPDSPLGSESDSVVQACGELLDVFRAQQLPVFYTTVIYDAPAQASVFRARLPALDVLQAGSNSVRVDARLAPRAHESVIVKQHASAFFGTSLAAELETAQADSLVVTGLTTSGCVRASVIDGLQHNYVVWVPREAVGDRNHDAHLANLHDMHAKYAEVVSLADTRRALLGAGTR